MPGPLLAPAVCFLGPLNRPSYRQHMRLRKYWVETICTADDEQADLAFKMLRDKVRRDELVEQLHSPDEETARAAFVALRARREARSGPVLKPTVSKRRTAKA